MKKVYTYLAVLAAAALGVFSCKPMPEDLSHVEEVVEAPAVNITVSDVADSSATITISPAGEASYYAYLVDKNDEDESASLKAASLYANEYSSVANGLVKYATASSTTIELKELDPNVTYQIYAVAGSTTGVVGEIAHVSFCTTDGETPMPGKPTTKENVLTVKFSEPVKYDESKPVHVIYYASNTAVIEPDASGKLTLVKDGAVGDAKAKVTVSGATASFTVTLDDDKPLPAGAFYTIAYPAGAFVDYADNPCAEMVHRTGVTSAGQLGFANLYGRVSTKEFSLVPAVKKVELVTDLTKPLKFGFPEGTYPSKSSKSAKGTILYEGGTYKLSYTFTGTSAFTYIQAEDSVAVYPHAAASTLPKPERGDKVTITLPKDYIADIYGNTNAEATIGPFLYSYGYKIDDVVGTYENSGASVYGTVYDETPWTFVLAKSDDAKKGNVMITAYYGFDNLKQYGTFDLDKGEFTFAIHNSVFRLGGKTDTVEGKYYAYYGHSHKSSKDAPNITMKMTELGKFTDGSDAPGYIFAEYKLPASGNIEDIQDEDYLGNDYNCFKPIFTKK